MPPKQRKKQAPATPRSAAKATAPSPSTPPQQPSRGDPAVTGPDEEKTSPLVMLFLFPILTIIATLSLAFFFYQRFLEPLYGSVPTNNYMDKLIWLPCLLGAYAPSPSLWSSLGLFGVLLSTLPLSSYWIAALTARWGDPLIGPLVTHALVLIPVVYAGIATVSKIVRIIESQSSQTTMLRYTILPACGSSITGLSSLWGQMESHGLTPSQTLQLCGGLCITIFAVSLPLRAPASAKSSPGFSLPWQTIVPVMVLPLLPLLLPKLEPPTLTHPLTEPFIDATASMRILYSERSRTGHILVGETLSNPDWKPDANESYPSSMRYLRASHSLLGGNWVGPKVFARDPTTVLFKDEDGTPLGDTIYSAFVVQEAVRLFEIEGRSFDEGEHALLIGLGTGNAATALIKHGVPTTVVEIDPAVYNVSRQFFGLPDVGDDHVFLEDARTYVRKKKTQLEQGSKDPKFTYVIHDLFSGGGVPAHLFTLQFWEELKAIMHPEGVVAVNFAGLLGTDSSRAVLLTLEKSFGQCRAFHDSQKVMTEEELLAGFMNMVFFCTPSTKPMTFRTLKEEDFLNSNLRSNILGNLPKSEIAAKLIRGDMKGEDGDKWVLKDENNRLALWQHSGALDHWKVMRQILPDVFWETY